MPHACLMFSSLASSLVILACALTHGMPFYLRMVFFVISIASSGKFQKMYEVNSVPIIQVAGSESSISAEIVHIYIYIYITKKKIPSKLAHYMYKSSRDYDLCSVHYKISLRDRQ